MLRGSLKSGFAPRDYKPANPELWDGCIAAWCPGLGPTGHALIDYSGSGYHGDVITSGTQMSPVDMWDLDDGGWALNFENTGSRGDNHVKLRASSQDMVDPTGAFAVSLWVRRTLDSAFDGFISFGDNFDNSFNLNHQVNDRFSIMCNDEPGLYILEDSTADRSSDFDWHHLIATSDASGLTIWVDGVKGSTGAVPTTQSSASAAYIGKMYANDTSAHGMNGYLDDIRVYNRPLCDEEIALLYTGRGVSYEYRLNYQFPPTPPTPINVNGTVADAAWDTQAPTLHPKLDATVADSEWDTQACSTAVHKSSTVANSAWDTQVPTVVPRFKAPDRDADWTLSSGTINTGDYYDESGSPGIGRLQDCVLRFDMTTTNASLIAFEDGKIFHAGDSSGGIWVGVTSNTLKVIASDNGGSGSITVNESVFGVFQDGVAKEVMIDVQSGRGNHSENGRIRLFLDGELIGTDTTTGGLYLSSGWFTDTSSEYLSYAETSMPHGEADGSITNATFGDLDFWTECNVGDTTFNGQANSQWDTQSATTATEQLATVADAEWDTLPCSTVDNKNSTVADAEWDTQAPATSAGLGSTVADAEFDTLACTTATEHPSTVSDSEWDTLAPTTQPKLDATVADSEWDTLPCSTVSHAGATVADAEWDTLLPVVNGRFAAVVANTEWDTLACSTADQKAATLPNSEWDTLAPVTVAYQPSTVADAEWDTLTPSTVSHADSTVADGEWDTVTPAISGAFVNPVADAQWDTLACSTVDHKNSTVADAEWDTQACETLITYAGTVASSEWDTQAPSTVAQQPAVTADAEWDVQPGMLPIKIPSVEADTQWDTFPWEIKRTYNNPIADTQWDTQVPVAEPYAFFTPAMSLTARLCPYAGEFLEFTSENAVSGSHKSEALGQHEMKSGSLSNTEMSGGSLSTAQMIRVGGTTFPTA